MKLKQAIFISIISIITSVVSVYFFLLPKSSTGEEVVIIVQEPENIEIPETSSGSTIKVMRKREIGGVLKPDSNGTWGILSNNNHIPVGLSHIVQNSYTIDLFYEKCSDSKITKSLDSDDALVRNHISVGGSVTNCYARIYMAKDGTKIRPDSITSSSAAIWVDITLLDEIDITSEDENE